MDYKNIKNFFHTLKEGLKRDSGGKGTLASLYELWPYMWVHGRKDIHKRILWAIFYLVLAKIIVLFVPYLYKFSTNSLQEKANEGAFGMMDIIVPVMLVLAYNIARVLQAAFNQLRDVLFAQVGQHAVRKLAYEAFVHVHKLSLSFHLQKRTGSLSRVIDRGVKGIEAIVRFSILNFIPTILEILLTVFVFWYSYGASYFFIIATTILLYTLFTIIASNWRINIRKEMNHSDTQASGRAVDSLLNFETVKYFNNEAWEASRFDDSMKNYEKAAIKTWVSLGWLNFGQILILSIGMATMMVMSAISVVKGTQTLGDFVFINALLIQISFPMNFMGSIYREIRQGITDMDAMFSLLKEPVQIIDKADAPNLQVTKANIVFENVFFAYDPRRPVLKNVSFEVPSGKTVALVGPSGAGKSTISRLLFRFYDVTSGQILIDGQNIRDVSQESLRSAIGMVPQDTVLFNDSLLYNIRYGRPDATEEEVKRAVDLAQISKFIGSLPEGYETVVGERGLKLSGGEKQRIAIARTLLKNPPILILDEATSALDTEIEREIQQALSIVSENRTSLVIAHRLSTIVNADEIIVLNHGEIEERGTHKALLEKQGLYASMWGEQKKEEEDKMRSK